MTETQPQPLSPWPHRLAVMLLCATFPLIWVGGLVTTTQSGMAVPDWPTTYGYNLFLYPWQTWVFGPWALFLEHGHRLLGALVGVLTIALLASFWRWEHRRWVHVLGVVALLGVIGQGVLGGMRVRLDARTLAQIHGCVGPAFFGLCVALSAVTSRWWYRAGRGKAARDSGKLERVAMITAVLAYVQLLLGSQVRHVPISASPGFFRAAVWLHVLMALVLLVHVLMVMYRARRDYRDEPAVVRPARWLTGLMMLQLVLGGASWLVKYGWPVPLADYAWTAGYTISAASATQTIIVTAHVATGSLILALALLVALRSCRLWRVESAGRREISVAGRPLAVGVSLVGCYLVASAATFALGMPA